MMRIWKRGEITVFLSLMLAVMLVFIQAVLQSSRNAMLRTEFEEALELAEYSVLSEYNADLLENYALFYLDLGYGGGAEDTDYLESRIAQFLDINLSDGQVDAIETWNYARATDDDGIAFYEQAVSYIKSQSITSIISELQEYVDYAELSEENGEAYEEADELENQNLEELERRREEEEEESTPDAAAATKSLKAGSILNLVIEDTDNISGKEADLSTAASNRTLLSGSGSRGINSAGTVNDVYFLAYLLEFFPDAVDYLVEGEESGEWLDYQLEYIIAGYDSDIENLESVCSRILLIREGMNYAYILTDSAKVAECEAMAALLVGVTLIPGLVEAVKQVLLLTWAFAESLLDVRLLMNGEKVSFYKSSSSWRLTLSSALELGDLSGLDDSGDESGLDYQDYLAILLALVGRSTKTMRSLDAVEGVIREMSGGTYFYIDQCVDSFWMRAVCTNGTELSAERWFCYEW